MPVVDPGEMSALNQHLSSKGHMSTCLLDFNSSLSIIKVPAGKAVKVTFKKFLLSEPGQENSEDCRKDYVEVNGKK